MELIKILAGEQLSFVQPSAIQQYYELRAQEEVMGKLTFPKSFGSLAEAEAYDGKWTFKRVGFFQTKITIRNFDEVNDIAVFKPNLMITTGALEFASGKKYQWESSNFWATRFEFKNESGETIVTFRSGVEDPKLKDWFKTQARIEIPDDKINHEDISLLILLGWYLIVVLQMDSAAGAVVSAAT